MNKECQEYLNLRTKPGMSGIREASWILGMPEDWIGILVNGHILPVAGGHDRGDQYYFATATLLRLAEDPDFYHRAIAFVRKAHDKKKDKKGPAQKSGRP
jgi:hypothetical protein